MDSTMEKNEIKFGDIPDDMEIKDYPEDTEFVLDDSEMEPDESFWEED